jgi:hypothetical protein
MKTTLKGNDRKIHAIQDEYSESKKTRDLYGITKIAFLVFAILFAITGVVFSIYIFNVQKSFNYFSSLKAICSFSLTFTLLRQYRKSQIDYKYYNSIYIKLGILKRNSSDLQAGQEIINIVFSKEET